MIRVLEGDCRDILPGLDRLDCCVTDPPYELSFMGRAWDSTGVAFQPETWAAVLRVLKPGGHLVAFGGSRTFHRMACAIEDAGFEIRDTLMWVYGTGFPKSHNISVAIDKAAGAVREVVGWQRNNKADSGNRTYAALGEFRQSAYSDITAPATPEAARWQGWGSALKPAVEMICLARKPLDGTLAANTLKHGVGGLNIDACRVESGDEHMRGTITTSQTRNVYGKQAASFVATDSPLGRWPANLLHDGSDEVLEAFAAFGEKTSGTRKAGTYGAGGSEVVYGERGDAEMPSLPGSTGSAARFFYSAKASKADRADSKHPTVKPLALMRWLARLITPPGGTILDPFAGSGTTGQAAVMEGFNAILIEQDAQHATDIRHRIRRWSGEDCPLFAEVAD